MMWHAGLELGNLARDIAARSAVCGGDDDLLLVDLVRPALYLTVRT